MSVGYQYVALRCVPAVEREEFVNVGVVVYSQMGDFLDASFTLNRERLQAFSPDLDVDEVERGLDTVCRICRGEQAPGRPDLTKLGQRFGWISAPRSTVIQPGPIHGGITEDPARELQRLANRLLR